MNVLEKKLLEDGASMPKAKKEALREKAAIEGEVIQPPRRNSMRRKVGARARVSQSFAAAYEEAFEKHGHDVFTHLAREEPANFAKIGVALMPKEMDINVSKFEGVSNDQLLSEFARALDEARSLGIDLRPGGDARANSEGKAHPALTVIPGDGPSEA